MRVLAKFGFNHFLKKITKHNLMWLYISHGSAAQISICHLWLYGNVFCYAAHALFNRDMAGLLHFNRLRYSDFRGGGGAHPTLAFRSLFIVL
jgi:hypothetical protein